MNTAPKCRICGCTQLRACVTEDGPCWWASPDLCSACLSAALQEVFSGQTPLSAIAEVAVERWRQVRQKGFDAAHDDDEHLGGELTRAAIAYAAHASVALSLGQKWGPKMAVTYAGHKAPGTWPWERAWWKPVSPRRDLLRAAALLIAEIEKIDRAEAAASAARERA
jgi:hypothetical protein